jgi:formylmethanofuran dehydrogenase subunit B
MREIAKLHPASYLHVICPFCGTLCDKTTALTWYSGCFCEYYKSKSGKVIFDTIKNTPRFAWGKAIQKSGGVRIFPNHNE